MTRQALLAAVLTLAIGACASSGGSGQETSSSDAGPDSTVSVTASASTSTSSTSSTTVAAATTTLPQTTSSFVEACVAWNPTSAILARVGDSDPMLEELGVFLTEEISGTAVTRIEYAQLYHPDEGEWQPYSTVQDDDLSLIHSMLHFNHARVELQVYALMQSPDSIVVRDGTHHDAGELASISRDVALYRDQDISDGYVALTGDVNVLSQAAAPVVMSAEERVAAWELAELHEGLYAPAAMGDFKAAVALRDVDLIEVRENLCSLMGTEAVLMVQAIESGTAVFGDLFPYLAAQELLLANEYLQEISNVLKTPDVDWFDNPTSDLTLGFDGRTTTGEYVGFLQSGAMGAILEYRALAEDL